MALTNTILVLRALGLGDLLTAVPVLRGLRREYPHAWIVLAAPQALAPLARLSGAVDEVVPTEGVGQLDYTGPRPALAVNLQDCGSQSIADLLATRPGFLITHRNADHPAVSGPPWQAGMHEVDRWCALLRDSAEIACDPTDLRIPRPVGPPRRHDVVVVHPGAASAARRWPADRFAAVATALQRDGHRVVVTGSKAEVPLAHEVAGRAGLGASAVLAGRLDMLELVALISDSRLVVCGDTGVGHVATATGTPSVLLFGPTPPDRRGPRGVGPHVTLWAGDVGDPHADRPHPGLLRINASDVLAASGELLAASA